MRVGLYADRFLYKEPLRARCMEMIATNLYEAGGGPAFFALKSLLTYGEDDTELRKRVGRVLRARPDVEVDGACWGLFGVDFSFQELVGRVSEGDLRTPEVVALLCEKIPKHAVEWWMTERSRLPIPVHCAAYTEFLTHEAPMRSHSGIFVLGGVAPSESEVGDAVDLPGLLKPASWKLRSSGGELSITRKGSHYARPSQMPVLSVEFAEEYGWSPKSDFEVVNDSKYLKTGTPFPPLWAARFQHVFRLSARNEMVPCAPAPNPIPAQAEQDEEDEEQDEQDDEGPLSEPEEDDELPLSDMDDQ